MAESHHKEIQRVDREIEQLSGIRDSLTRHIRSLNEYRIRLAGKPSTPSGKREVVSRIEFKPYVARYLELHQIHYENNGITQLSQASGVSEPTIRNILHRTEQQWVFLETVDSLVRGMGMEHILSQLTVIEIVWPIRPKPIEPPFSHYEEN